MNEDMTELKELPINKAYLISDNGRIIKNKMNGRLIKSSEQLIKGKPSGYIYATLCTQVNGEGRFFPMLPKRIAVHRLVAFAWLGPPSSPAHKWINHKDGNKANNHYSNLEWTTISENIQHSYDVLGRVIPKGSDHWLHGKKASKATRAKMAVAKIGAKHPKFKGYYFVNWKRYESTGEAARKTGLNAKTIHSRCHNPKYRINGFYFVPVNNENSI